MMRFYPVPEKRIDSLLPLIERAHGEMDMPKLATLDQAKRLLAAGYAHRSLAAYVDDIKNPKHTVIVSAVPGIDIEGVLVIVHLVYSVPEERGRADVVAGMHKTIDGFAADKQAGQILGTSWEYGNSKPIPQMWTGQGYVKHSVNYIKELT